MEKAVAAVSRMIDDKTILFETADDIVGRGRIVFDYQDFLAQ
jgi:hypothetical protein